MGGNEGGDGILEDTIVPVYVIVGHFNVERPSLSWKIDELVELSISSVYFG